MHTRPTTREGPSGHKSHQGLKGSPSTKKLPPVAKDTKTEDSNANHSGEVENRVASTSGLSQPDPTSTEREVDTIPSTTEDGPVAASSDKNEHLGEVAEEEGTKFAPGSATATENTIANGPVEPLIIREEQKPKIEASQSEDAEPSAEKTVVPEDPEIPAGTFVEAAVETKEQVTTDESEDTVLAADKLGETENNEVKSGTPEELKDEPTTEDSVTTA